MKKAVSGLALLSLLTVPLMSLEGCGCGFDCGNDSSPKITTLDLGFSDESVEQLKQVVIEVDRISFRRTGAEDVVVDSFTIEELGLTGVDSFQVDLLQYRGLKQLLVIENLELDTANYSELLIDVLDDDINRSYVQESDDSLKPIDVAGSVLSLPGPALVSGDQQFTVAFSLARALHYREDTDVYRLTTEGIRVIDDASAASLSGRVDNSLFDTTIPCDTKAEPTSGNRVYLYAGTALAPDSLADVFTGDSTTGIPNGARAPYAVAALAEDTLTGSWQYAIGFLEPGDYSLAFSCNAADDDPVNFDGIVIPLPTSQVYEISLTSDEKAICDLAENASC